MPKKTIKTLPAEDLGPAIGEQLIDFRESLDLEDWSPAAAASYEANVRQFASWYVRTYRQPFIAESIVQRDVQEHRAWMQKEGSAAESINRRLVSIRKFYDWIGGPNPAAAVKGLQVVDPGVQALSMVELRRLLREVHVHRNVRDIAILEFLCHTGIRVGELVALQMSDVEISEKRGLARIRNGKGGVSRDIPLNNDVRKALRAWIDERPADRGDRLFLGQRGPMTPSAVWRIVRRYGDYAGIEELHVHQLRHTVLTRLVREQGIDLATVAKISGHTSIRTLLRYAAPTQDDMANAMEGLTLTD